MTPYYETALGKLYHGNCLDILPEIEPVDLIVTSPPYDGLREYKGYSFDWRMVAKAINNAMADGAVCVWVVGDETTNGSESGTSFKQALWFKHIGLNLHDTMIYAKPNFSAVGALSVRYAQVFEYMFVFTKGRLKTFNPIKDRYCSTRGQKKGGTIRQKDGSMKRKSNEGKVQAAFGQRYNIWEMTSQTQGQDHPAPFPIKLAIDHIVSWSNIGDLVLDPMSGSGTTAVACERLNRRWIVIEISEEYCEISARRIERETSQLKLF